MTQDQPTTDPRDEALNALALLCGGLVRTLRHHGLMGDGDVEAMFAGLEGASPSPVVTQLLHQVRWAAEWTKRADKA